MGAIDWNLGTFGGFGAVGDIPIVNTGEQYGPPAPEQATPNGEVLGLPTSNAPGSQGTPLWQTIVGDAWGIGKGLLAWDTANNQINHGQYPSVIGQNGQLSGTANVSPYQATPGWLAGGSSVLVIVVIALFVLLVVKK